MEQSAPTVPTQTPVQVRVVNQSKFLTVEYVLAMIATLFAAWLSSSTITSAISLFGEKSPVYDTFLSWFFDGTSGYTGVVITAIGAVVFSVVAFLLFKRVSATVPKRPGYTKTTRYRVTTYSGLVVLALKTVTLTVSTVAVALTPLLTIQEGVNVGNVYLYQFLPMVIALGIFGFTTYCVLKITEGRNKTSLLSTILLALAAVFFILAVIAVIVDSHRDTASTYKVDTSSSSSSSNSSTTTDSSKSESSSSNSKADTCTDLYKQYIDKKITLDEYIDGCSDSYKTED